MFSALSMFVRHVCADLSQLGAATNIANILLFYSDIIHQFCKFRLYYLKSILLKRIKFIITIV